MAELKRTLQNLTPNTRYIVRVRAVNEFGLTSEWGDALDFTTKADDSVPLGPTGLVLDFDSPSLVAAWVAASANVDGTPLLDFQFFEVTLAFGGITKKYLTTSPFFTYNLTQNRLDFGTPQPQIEVSVATVDVSGNRSGLVIGTAINAEPPTPEDPPELTTGFTFINITMPSPTGMEDLDGFELWHSTNGTVWAHLVDTANGVNNYTHAVAQGTIHYYRYKVRDVFGQVSPDFSPSATATTYTIQGSDDEPPVEVANLRLTATDTTPDGRAYVDLAWDFNTEDDLGSYELRWRRPADAAFSSVVVGTDFTTYRVSSLLPNTTYEFQIRAIDISNNASPWAPADPLDVLTAQDDTEPAAPANLVATPGARTIILQWDANTEANFDHYDIHVSDAAGFTPTADTLYDSRGVGTIETIRQYWDGDSWEDLVPGNTYYIKMIAVSRSGVASQVSLQAAGVAGYIDNEDFTAESITADRLMTSTLTADITISGSIATATGGARMEMNSSGLVGYNNLGLPNMEYLNDVDPPGFIVSNDGYLRSDDYVAGTSGWFLGAGSGSGLLEINEGMIRARALQIGVSNENLLQNSSFENYPAAGTQIATNWTEYRSGGAASTFAISTTALYQSRSQRVTVVGTPAYVGLSQAVVLGATPIEASPTEPVDVTLSYWVTLPVALTRRARVALFDVANNLTFVSPPVALSTSWVRVVLTTTLVAPANQFEARLYVENTAGNLVAGDAFLFEGAQFEISSFPSSYHPATLDIPDNYINNAHIAELTADKLRSGRISAATIEVDAPAGYIQSISFDEGLEQGYRLSSSKIEMFNGGVEIKGVASDGSWDGVYLDSTNLRAVYGTGTQFKVDGTGIYFGGDNTTNADMYVDTTNARTVFQGSVTGNTFSINSDPADGKVLRLHPTAGGPDSFYLTYDGLGFFNKGVIGQVNGAGGNRVKNSSFESRAASAAAVISGSGADWMNYWSSYSTGTGTVTVTQVGGGIHGGYAARATWTTNVGRKGISQMPWVGGTNSALWPANSTWMVSFWMYQSGTMGLPELAFDYGGSDFVVTPIAVPAASSGWQRYVYRVAVQGTARTSPIYIFFTHANGTVTIDGVQIERGEIANPYSPMQDEVLPPGSTGGSSGADDLRSSNYVSGVSGWRIRGDGWAELNDIVARGTVSVTAGGYTMEFGKDVGPGGGHHGLSLDANTFNNIFLRREGDNVVFFRVNAGGSGGYLTFEPSGPTSGTLTVGGAINATSGTFGNMTINGPLTATGQTITGGTLSGATLSGGAVSGGTISIGGGAFQVNSGGATLINAGLYFGSSFAAQSGHFAWEGGGTNRVVFNGGNYNPPYAIEFRGQMYCSSHIRTNQQVYGGVGFMTKAVDDFVHRIYYESAFDGSQINGWGGVKLYTTQGDATLALQGDGNCVLYDNGSNWPMKNIAPSSIETKVEVADYTVDAMDKVRRLRPVKFKRRYDDRREAYRQKFQDIVARGPRADQTSTAYQLEVGTAARQLAEARKRWTERLSPTAQTPEIGFIAEEVQEIEPYLVAPASGDVSMGLMYGQFTALHTRALQEMDARLDAIETRLNEQP